MKNKLLLLASIFVVVYTAKIFAQTDYVKWELANDSNAVSVGNVSSLSNPEVLSNLVVRGYSTDATTNIRGQKLSVNPDGIWAGNEKGPVNDRYVEFGLAPLPGYNFTVTSISFYAGWTGSSYIYANAYYSTDSTFATKTLLQENMAPGSTPHFYSSTLNLTIYDGQKLYIRFYPWATRQVNGKNWGLGQLIVSGTTSSSTSPSIVISPLSLTFGRVRTGEFQDLSFALSGSGLTPASDSIRLTAPEGFLMSLNPNNGFSSYLAIPYVGSKLNLLTIYVRFAPSVIKTYTDSVIISGGGATPQSLYVRGIGVDPNTILNPPAFPSAEGYGKYATGGRGGVVYEVTNLNATGPGSLGEAINATGPRTVVFKVSGTITGDFTINNGNITIAGQTAPGDGICIKGSLSINADNVIIRYIRVRYNYEPTKNGDAIGGRYHKNIIIDHVSASWSADEVFSFYHNDSTTVQWCIISEGCEKYENGVSVGHRFGGIWGNNYGTWHHNLIAHNDSRNPRWASGSGYNDFRNNVIYNWGYKGAYGGEAAQPNDPKHTFTSINIVANYYKAGPASQNKTFIIEPSARSENDKGSWYLADNYVYGYPAVTANNWLGVTTTNYIKLNEPWPAMSINQETAEQAYLSVLEKVGCSLPNRDSLDRRIIEEVRTGTAKFGRNGIINNPSDVGGWPTLASKTPPADDDHDGMPNDWEIANGLNPNDPSDRNIYGYGGYTMLEIYLNTLTGEISTDVTDNQVSLPNEFILYQNYPNPFNPTTNITFELPVASNVTVKVFNLLGQEVATVYSGYKTAGKHTVQFNASHLGSGVYFYKVEAGKYVSVKKMILMK